MEEKKPFLDNIYFFRGIAIIFIVFGHCMSFGVTQFYNNNSLFANLIKYFAPGGTYFFVFISGYLLYYLYGEQIKLRSLLYNKIKYVALPFILFASMDIFYFLTRIIFSILISSNSYHKYLLNFKSIDLVKIYLLGDSHITIGLWYVPFIMVIFSLSKIFINVIKLKKNVQVLIISIFFIISLIIHRADCNCVLGIFQNVIYYTPVFLLGIFLSANQELFYYKFSGKSIYFIAAALFILFIQVKISDMEYFHLINGNNIDLMIVQKTFLTIFFVLFLHNNEFLKIKFIGFLASNSFGIFFIHGFFIWLINALVFQFKISFKSSSIVIYILNAILVLGLSLCTTILIRRLLQKKSRYIIGC
jgi:surface polysaccharide O-acyltransferase-like enzyme